MSRLLEAINEAFTAGLAVLPVKHDGSKRPDVDTWTQYQKVAPTAQEVRDWYTDGGRTGLGIVTGAVSKGLEMFEFEGRSVADGVFDEFIAAASSSGLGDVVSRIVTGYSERTPSGGIHWLYRVDAPLPNTKLARRPATESELEAEPDDKIKLLIETRGEGGFVIVAPSNGTIHPDGGAWTLESGGFATITTITVEERDALFDLARTFDRMPVREARRPTRGVDDRPGDRLAADPDINDIIRELLERHGWTYVYSKGDVLLMRRPGKRFGVSASIGFAGPGVFHVFTTSTEFEAEASHHPFGVYAQLEHGGDFRAAAQALAEKYPDPTFRPRTKGRRPKVDPEAPARLPETFYAERPYLTHIRQAAQSRQRAPDAVLGAVLGRVAATAPHTLGLPAIVGTEAGLSCLVGIIGQPGGGKSTGVGIADELLPDPKLVVIPSGSGEGFAEAFFDYVEVIDDKGKKKPERQQVHHNLFVYVDEGQSATRQAMQATSTLYSSWRKAFSGAMLGEQNASAERRRKVPAGSYQVGIVVGFQPATLKPLFDDLPIGTPQRFIYLEGMDPTLPDDPPRWPGPLDVPRIDLERAEPQFRIGGRSRLMRVHISVSNEIRRADLERQRGVGGGDPWAAHRNLVRLKVAALLAMLDGRVDVSEDDWRLGAMVVDVSDAVRRQAQAVIADTAAQLEDETATRYARRAVRVDELTEQRAVIRCLDAIVKKVKAEPGRWTQGKLRMQFSGRLRDHFGEALDKALDAGWVEKRAEPGQGEDRVRLHPGRSP